jgi:putative phosphoesterase
MRIIVVSDTHGAPELLLSAVRQAGKTDMLLHLGDGQRDCGALERAYGGEVRMVRGNCDFMGGDLYEQILSPGGVVVFMTHGHLYDAKLTLNKLWYKGQQCGADIVCFGHTHMPLLDRQGKLTLLNPGSLRHGRTYGLIEIRDGKADVKIRDLR